ncbi:hypothetical protein BKA80DRAFT_128864 [Phyllosticta citrichinensis]
MARRWRDISWMAAAAIDGLLLLVVGCLWLTAQAVARAPQHGERRYTGSNHAIGRDGDGIIPQLWLFASIFGTRPRKVRVRWWVGLRRCWFPCWFGGSQRSHSWCCSFWDGGSRQLREKKYYVGRPRGRRSGWLGCRLAGGQHRSPQQQRGLSVRAARAIFELALERRSQAQSVFEAPSGTHDSHDAD